MKRLLTLGILLLCWGANGATTNCPNATYSVVSGAIASAGRGDTVVIPAASLGSVTWSSPITLTQGVTIKGAGRTSTFITVDTSSTIGTSGCAFLLEPDSTAIANGELIKITDIAFDGHGTTATWMYNDSGANWASGKAFTNLVVGNNTFSNFFNGNGGILYTRSQVRGCIYSNIVDMCNENWRIFGNNDVIPTLNPPWTDEWNSGVFPQSWGTGDQLFIEGNTIKWSSSYSSSDPGYSETGQGARVVMRYNTYDFRNVTPVYGVIHDIHGFQWFNKVDINHEDGTMCSEYYGNTYINYGGAFSVEARGGWCLCFNNRFTGCSPSFRIQQYGLSPWNSAGDTQSGCMADLAANFPSYSFGNPPYNGDLTNHYIWNNDQGGSEMGFDVNLRGCGIAANTNWFPSSSIIKSTANPSGSPGGPHYAWWRSPSPTSTTMPAVIQNSTLYISWNGSTWTPAYTPYIFPHPLSANTVNPNSAPTNLRITTQSSNLSVGSALTLTASADGTPPIYYQWAKTNDNSSTFTNIPGATAYQFTITNAQTTDSGWYEFIATNTVPPYSATSAPVYISVTAPNTNMPGVALVRTNSGVNFSSLTISNISLAGANKMLVVLDYSYSTNGNKFTSFSAREADGSVRTGLLNRTNYYTLDGYLDLWFGYPMAVSNNASIDLLCDSSGGPIGEAAVFAVLLTNAWYTLYAFTNAFETPVSWAITNGTTATTNSISVATVDGELVLDVLVSGNNQYNATAGQTNIGQVNLPTKGTWLQISKKPAPSSSNSTTMGWSGPSDYLSHLALAIKGPPPPLILAKPAAQTNVAGSTIALSSPAEGTDDISYQWAVNSEPITNTAYTGIQTTNLTLAHASWRDSGYYSVLTTNAVGIVASEPVYVEIAHPPYKAAGVGRMGRSRW